METGFEIADPCYANNKEAYFEVRVRGPEKNGTMYFWAGRPTDNDKWDINRLELQLKNDDKRLVIVKPKDNPVEST